MGGWVIGGWLMGGWVMGGWVYVIDLNLYVKTISLTTDKQKREKTITIR